MRRHAARRSGNVVLNARMISLFILIGKYLLAKTNGEFITATQVWREKQFKVFSKIVVKCAAIVNENEYNRENSFFSLY